MLQFKSKNNKSKKYKKSKAAFNLKFYEVMRSRKNYLRAVYLLGNLLRETQDTAHNVELSALKKRSVSTDTSEKIDMQALWSAIVDITPQQFALQSRGNKASISACKNWIINDIELLKTIGQDHLIQLAADENYYRIVFIALIQNHSVDNTEVFKDFDYILIRQATAEQTHLSVQPFISRCATLPVKAIEALGRTNPKIAQNILYDLPLDHPDTPAIMQAFYEHHPQLEPVDSDTEKESIDEDFSMQPSFLYLQYIALCEFISGIFSFLYRILTYFFKSTNKINATDEDLPDNNLVDDIELGNIPITVPVKEHANTHVSENKNANDTENSRENHSANDGASPRHHRACHFP